MGTINPAGMQLLREFEGCKLTAYRCPARILTIGYGHTGSDVTEGLKITQPQAGVLLARDIERVAGSVRRCLTVAPNENQFAAMVCLAFNIGAANFKTSSVRRLHNSRKTAEAAAAFMLWNKATGADRKKRELKGLTRRRAAEMQLYLTPTEREEEADPQRTRSNDVVSSEQSATPEALSAATKIGLTAAAGLVSTVSEFWDGLSKAGISPTIIIWAVAAVVIGASLWTLYKWHVSRVEGRA